MAAAANAAEENEAVIAALKRYATQNQEFFRSLPEGSARAGTAEAAALH